MISKRNKIIVLSMAIGLALVGCNVGNAPSGGTPEEITNNFHKMDPQEQIKIIQSSPAPEEKKAQLIKEIEDKYGVKAGQAPTTPGANGQTAPPPPATTP